MGKLKNNELYRIEGFSDGHIDVTSCASAKPGRIQASQALHLDQGIAVTSHASQGKTVDQVIGSVPVSSFCQVNEKQFYVTMSRARHAMRLITDSHSALREAVTRQSDRLSPSEIDIRDGSIAKAVRMRHHAISRQHDIDRSTDICR